MVPELPADIYSLFAEFLAGSCAFGTLANLNVANHAVHNETLPVLYETVLQDTPEEPRHCEVAKLIFSKEPIPKRFSFTKFLICRPTGNLSILSSLLQYKQTSFPNLSMILIMESYDAAIPYSCRVFLLRPLKPSTVFRIVAQTPVYHEPFDHHSCHRDYGSRPNAATFTACELEKRKPCIRPAERVRQITITDYGWLLADDGHPNASDEWSTILRFQNTCVHHLTLEDTVAGKEHHLDAIFEVLKMIAYRRHRSVAPEPHLVISPCEVRERYRDFHVAISLDDNQFLAFVEKYSSVVTSFPKIIDMRLRVFLADGCRTADFLQETLGKLRTAFETHTVSSKDATLLGDDPRCCTLLEIRGPYYDIFSDSHWFGAFHPYLIYERGLRAEGYIGRLVMVVKRGVRRFIVKTFAPEDLDRYDEDSDEYDSEDSSEDFDGSEVEQD